MSGQGTPEVGKRLHVLVTRLEAPLEFSVRVDVDDNRKRLGQDHLDGVVQILKVVGGEPVRLSAHKHGLRSGAEPDMVKAECPDQFQILRGDVGLEMVRHVPLAILDLGKPVAKGYSASECFDTSSRLVWRGFIAIG